VVHPLLDTVALAGNGGPADSEHWLALAECLARVPAPLRPWLEEPGLLTSRVHAQCGADARLRLLRLEPAPLDPGLAHRLGVDDPTCLLREIEFTCGARRWVFAQSIFPQATVATHPWLRELGDRGLGESLSAVEDVRREPLEYLELPVGHPLARAALPGATDTVSLWARRAVYRLGGLPILVQEVFLPALGRCD
jgi:chorismate--pyruvate lyase